MWSRLNFVKPACVSISACSLRVSVEISRRVVGGGGSSCSGSIVLRRHRHSTKGSAVVGSFATRNETRERERKRYRADDASRV